MRLREVFRYEFGYRLRAASTWLYAAFLFLIAFWIVHVGADGSSPVHVNAPQKLAEMSALFCGLFGILVTAGLFADAAIRDVAAGMDALLYTTRLRKSEYLGGRFLAALAINSIVILAIPLGLAVATLMPYLPREAFGPNRLAAFVQPVLLFLLPNVLLAGAILFTIAALARQVIPVYLGAIGIFISYIVAANYWSAIDSPILSVIADPLGINAFMGITKLWTEAECNTRLVGFPAILLWNRVLWMVVAGAVFAVLNRAFRFGVSEGNGKAVALKAAAWPAHSKTVPQVSGVFGPRTRVRQLFAVARQSLVEVMSGRAFQIAFLGAIGLVLLWGWNVGSSVFDTSTWPVTHLVAAVAVSQRATLIPWLVIALYAGELVWKEREAGSADIGGAVPVPTGVVFLGRFLALVAIIVVFQIAMVIGGVLIQALQGYYDFEPGLYLRIVFGLNLAGFLLLAALAMTVHVLVNQKYLGYIVVLLACIYKMAGPAFGIHSLLVYNSAPHWKYSDMNGFGPFIAPFVWLELYWAAWALLLGVIAVLFWVRGPEPGLRRRFAIARARFRGRIAQTAAVAIVLILAFGGFVFYNTNVLNEYHSASTAGAPQAEYERRYARYENAPQPVIAAAEVRVEIHPGQPAVDLRGSYRLVNRTAAAIDSIHVVVDRDVDVRSIAFDRKAKPSLVDDDHGYRIFALEQPLAAGDSLHLTFDVAFRPRGFPDSGIQTSVVRNGAYFHRNWLPFVGYQPLFELRDADERKRFGLAATSRMPSPRDAGAGRYDDLVRNENDVRAEMIVGTPSDQIAVTPGVLRRSWIENGRRYAHYGIDVPTAFAFTVFSAKYERREDRWKNVLLEIFHHPKHRYDIDRMFAGMKASLDYCSKNFAPFQFPQLRIVEVPPYSIHGRAHPGTIAFSEDAFITRVRPGEIDQSFYGTAHEVGHQWWGGQARPAHARGAGFLSESLANYTAMMVTEKTFGRDVAQRVYGFQMDRYLSARAELSREVPLIEAEDQSYIFYRRGAVAMYTLRDQLGEEAVNTALRRYLGKFRDNEPPYPTSLDLIAELRAVTPSELQYLITDLFETVTLWDVKTERAAVEKLQDGRYAVTLDVVARKLRADSSGRETETPMNDFVEIGAFAADTEIYLARHRIHSGRQTLRIVVPREPARAGIDPHDKLIDRDRDDNMKEVRTR